MTPDPFPDFLGGTWGRGYYRCTCEGNHLAWGGMLAFWYFCLISLGNYVFTDHKSTFIIMQSHRIWCYYIKSSLLFSLEKFWIIHKAILTSKEHRLARSTFIFGFHVQLENRCGCFSRQVYTRSVLTGCTFVLDIAVCNNYSIPVLQQSSVLKVMGTCWKKVKVVVIVFLWQPPNEHVIAHERLQHVIPLSLLHGPA